VSFDNYTPRPRLERVNKGKVQPRSTRVPRTPVGGHDSTDRADQADRFSAPTSAIVGTQSASGVISAATNKLAERRRLDCRAGNGDWMGIQSVLVLLQRRARAAKSLPWRLRQESNLYLALRRRPFYPLNYGGVG
jgi:hypothetical protein